MHDEAELTIGEVARRAGVATSSIRYYESIGLLPEPDRLHGQRRYDAGVLGRLAFIGVAQSAGFKIAEIMELVVERTRAIGIVHAAVPKRTFALGDECAERSELPRRLRVRGGQPRSIRGTSRSGVSTGRVR